MAKLIFIFFLFFYSTVLFGQSPWDESGSDSIIKENLERSLVVLKNAIKKDSTNHALYYLKGLTEVQLGLWREAEKSFELSDSLLPQDPEDEYIGWLNSSDHSYDYLPNVSKPEYPGGEKELKSYLTNAELPKSSANNKGKKINVKATITVYGNAYVDMANAKSLLDSQAYDHVFRMPFWHATNKEYDTILEVTFTKVSENPGTYKLPPNVEPDTVPQFGGGEEEMMKYIKKSIRYPPFARENDIEGTVYVSFIVDETGRVIDVKIAKSAAKILDDECLRIMRFMPPWIPAYKDGKPSASEFVLPISFRLN